MSNDVKFEKEKLCLKYLEQYGIGDDDPARDSIANAFAVGYSIAQKAGEACTWECDEDNYFDTGCGDVFQLIDGTIKENHIIFCPYCGKKIKEEKQ